MRRLVAVFFENLVRPDKFVADPAAEGPLENKQIAMLLIPHQGQDVGNVHTGKGIGAFGQRIIAVRRATRVALTPEVCLRKIGKLPGNRLLNKRAQAHPQTLESIYCDFKVLYGLIYGHTFLQVTPLHIPQLGV